MLLKGKQPTETLKFWAYTTVGSNVIDLLAGTFVVSVVRPNGRGRRVIAIPGYSKENSLWKLL